MAAQTPAAYQDSFDRTLLAALNSLLGNPQVADGY